MKYTSELDVANSICRVCVSGTTHTLKDGDRLKQFARTFFAEHGCYKFLFDMRQTKIVIGTMAALEAGAPQGEMAKALKPLKVAVVVQKISEDLHFFETVAINRGFSVQVFDAINKGIEWLKPK